jgi:hypothetical protein
MKAGRAESRELRGRLDWGEQSLATLLTVPNAPFWLGHQSDASKVEPFIGAALIVACYHVSIRNIFAEAVERLPNALFVLHQRIKWSNRVAVLPPMMRLLSLWRLSSESP